MKILILDIETTGFDLVKDKILEVGAVELNLETQEIKTVFDEAVKETGVEDFNLEESWIAKNSNILTNYYERALSEEDFQYKLQVLLDKYVLGGVTAFNNQFDFGFLESRGFIIPKKLACPMKILTPIMKLPGRFGYKWPNVEEAYSFFFPDNDYVEKHRGLDDAYHEAKIVYELYKVGRFEI